MRLHEFTKPKDYIMSDTEAADPSELIKAIKRDDEANDAESHLTNQRQTEKPTPPNTASV